MADDSDYLDALVGGQIPQGQQKAIASQLRAKGLQGQLLALSGDKGITDLGNRMISESDNSAKTLGADSIQNRSEDLANQRYQQLVANEGLQRAQSAKSEQDLNTRASAQLAEERRWHDMTQEDRQERLAAKTAAQSPDGQKTIDAIYNLRAPLPANRSAKNGALIEELYTQHPDYDPTQYKDKLDTMTAFGKGKQGDLVRSSKVAVDHLDTAEQKFDELGNSNSPLFNTIRNTYLNAKGDPRVKSLQAAKDIVSDEMTKFVVGGGMTQADRQGLQKQLDEANSPDQFHAVVGTFRQLMAGQMQGLKSQYENNTHRDFIQDQFKDASSRAYDVFGFKDPNAAPPTAPPQAGGGPQPPVGSALPGAMAQQAPPPATPGGLRPLSAPQASALATGGSLPLSNPQPAPAQPKIVRTGKRNGKKVGQTADGQIVDLE